MFVPAFVPEALVPQDHRGAGVVAPEELNDGVVQDREAQNAILKTTLRPGDPALRRVLCGSAATTQAALVRLHPDHLIREHVVPVPEVIRGGGPLGSGPVLLASHQLRLLQLLREVLDLGGQLLQEEILRGRVPALKAPGELLQRECLRAGVERLRRARLITSRLLLLHRRFLLNGLLPRLFLLQLIPQRRHLRLHLLRLSRLLDLLLMEYLESLLEGDGHPERRWILQEEE